MDGLIAWLGENNNTNPITVLDVSSTVITGTISPDIPGVYGLSVENLDAQNDTLSPAFTIYPLPHPGHTFVLPDAYISTFGPAAPSTEGDDDHIQVIYFELPDTAPSDLYVRIFDADTSNEHDVRDRILNVFNTVMTYTLRGGPGAYVVALDDNPSVVTAGQMITQVVVGADGALNNAWLTLPITLSQGEQIGGLRVFKLVVQGAAGDDGNGYHVILSAASDSNVIVTGARVFAFEWCVVLPGAGDEVTVYPYVPSGANTIVQNNFDFGRSAGDDITITTPTRFLPDILQSQNDGGPVDENLEAFGDEGAATWSARYVTGGSPVNNSFSLWFQDSANAPLAVFTAPTRTAPP